MNGRSESKLNKLLRDWPKGTVAAMPWLKGYGVYRQLAQRYVASGWIERLGRGAFVRAGETVDWLGAVYALQAQLGLNIRVGGLTALSLRGYGHYLPLGSGVWVYLFSDSRERLPSWFVRHKWNVKVRHRCVRLFEDLGQIALTDLDRGNFVVRASSPERAILEVMHLANTNSDVDQALELFAGLTTLRPPVVQELLEGCRSVKVKRLFLWAGESAGHKWLEEVDTRGVDLGRGKRMLYHGGRMDSNYRITVPRVEGLPDV